MSVLTFKNKSDATPKKHFSKLKKAFQDILKLPNIVPNFGVLEEFFK
jgi:hypothetical protein